MIIFSLLVSLMIPIPARTAAPVPADAKVIKFATLAPEGSTWMKVMTELNTELQEKTQGQLRFKMYPGGVQGDDKDVVKKIRIGQLHAAGFTGVGLGEIAPAVRILDAPWLLWNDHEVDFIYKNFAPELNAAVEQGGFVLLGWTELGYVYIFSKNPINSPEDIKKSKMWVWEGDPIALAAYKVIGASPRPLSVVDVMSSLETGLIDGVYGPPLGITALQWFRRVKYIYSVPIANSAGAVLLSKKMFDSIPRENRRILLETCAKHLRRLNLLTREENIQAMAVLQKQGLILSKPASAQTMALYQDLGRQARQELAGKLYDAKLLERVEKSLSAYRARPDASESSSPSSKGLPSGKAKKS